MALEVNLLFPKQQADLERKLDPIKIGLLLALVICMGMIAWWMLLGAKVQGQRNVFEDLNRKWRELEPRSKEAAVQKEEDLAQSATAEALVNWVNSRFYWSPILSELAQATPPKVQIISLNGTYTPDGKILNLTFRGRAAGKDQKDANDTADEFSQRFENRLEDLGFDVNKDFPMMLYSAENTVSLEGEKYGLTDFEVQMVAIKKPDSADGLASEAPATAQAGG